MATRRLNGKNIRHRTLMSDKFYSMLLSGTLTMMVVSVLLMSDSVIAGAMIGSDAVAGITLVTPLYSLAAFFASIFSLGVPIIYSTEMGKFNKSKADQAFGFGLLMSIAVGVSLFLLATFFGDMYLRSSAPPESVLNEARGYLFWMRFTILVIPPAMLIDSMVYSDGDENLSTVANIVQGVGNIIASVLLARIMGIRGIGLASFLFNAISMVILFTHLLKKSNSLRLNLYFSRNLVKEVVRYSIIDASTYLFLSILVAVLNAFVSVRFGAQYLLLVSVVTLCRELQMIFDGIGEAITPILSVYLGESSGEGIKSICRRAYKVAITEGIVVMLALIVCAPWIPRLLDITDPVMLGHAVTGVRILSLGSVFVSLLYLLTSYYNVIEKIMLGLLVGLFRDMLLGVLLAVGLGAAFGQNGMFAGLAAASAAAYALLLLYLTGRFGRENTPLLLSTLSLNDKNFMFDLTIEPDRIIGLQQKVEALLTEKGIAPKTTGRVALLIEELYMLIFEKNADKEVLSECTVILRPEGVQIIEKDNGVLFDISEEDAAITSFSSYVVSLYMVELGSSKRHLTTMSFNRTSFIVGVD